MNQLEFQLFTLEEWKAFLQYNTRECLKDKYYVNNFNDILQIVYKFCLDMKSPICFIYSESKVLVCKIGFENSIRKICIEEEIQSLKLLDSVNKEWKPFLQARVDIDHTENFLISFTEYCCLHNQSKCRTLRELSFAKECGDLEFRGCIFQCLALLKHLQNKFPGFRHNDLKADNILITQGAHNVQTFELETKNGIRYFKVPCNFQCVMVDFESTWWKGKEVSKNEELIKLKEAFGIFEIDCSIFDFHLLCMDILRCSKADNGYWEPHFQYFYTFLMDFFQEWHFKKEHLKEYRLQRKHQLVTRWDLTDMMLHPYFYGFRYVSDGLEDNILHI